MTEIREVPQLPMFYTGPGRMGWGRGRDIERERKRETARPISYTYLQKEKRHDRVHIQRTSFRQGESKLSSFIENRKWVGCKAGSVAKLNIASAVVTHLGCVPPAGGGEGSWSQTQCGQTVRLRFGFTFPKTRTSLSMLCYLSETQRRIRRPCMIQEDKVCCVLNCPWHA